MEYRGTINFDHVKTTLVLGTINSVRREDEKREYKQNTNRNLDFRICSKINLHVFCVRIVLLYSYARFRQSVNADYTFNRVFVQQCANGEWND